MFKMFLCLTCDQHFEIINEIFSVLFFILNPGTQLTSLTLLSASQFRLATLQVSVAMCGPILGSTELWGSLYPRSRHRLGRLKLE